MELTLKMGTVSQSVSVAEENLLGVLLPEEIAAAAPEAEILRAALESPIGTPRLREIARPGEKIAIVTSDITRPMPTARVIGPVLDELYAAGCRREDILLVFALGSHRGHSPEERRRLAGERAWAEIECVDADPSDCVRLGFTKNGTPVDIDRRVAQADRRVCLGNIEYHYFAGYSGGAKAIMPGVSTRSAIQANHSRMVDPMARAGQLEGNPVRMDIEEAADRVGVDFILNVVLDAHKQIVHAVAGDVRLAHRAGCRFLDAMYRREIPALADIVLVSQGGAPKDLNLYQTQKALANAEHAVKPGGVIVLVGSCREGLGEATFQDWMLSAGEPHELVERIQREFRLGGHKAAAIAMVLEKADIYLVSELPDELVRQVFLQPFHSVAEACAAAMGKCGPGAKVIAMPYGGSTLPVLSDNKE